MKDMRNLFDHVNADVAKYDARVSYFYSDSSNIVVCCPPTLKGFIANLICTKYGLFVYDIGSNGDELMITFQS